MFENHVPIPISDFNGLFDRGPDEAIPLDHFKQAYNLKYGPSRFQTRDGSVLEIQCDQVLRFYPYKITGQASRLLVLRPGGYLWDSTDMTNPILIIPEMVDFSMEVFFDRAYITPHNGVTGLPGQFVYYYTGSGPAKIAAGTEVAPIGSMTVLERDQGKIDMGWHAWAVGFETATGFITKFGAFVNMKNEGGHYVQLNNIPVGPIGTVARVIFSTKNVSDAVAGTFNGDYENAEWFFVPNGRIPDNTTTSQNINYYDADLVDQADYILEQLPKIPAGVGITSYQGSMVVWGEDANQSTVRVSKAGEPESFNAVEGFIQVEPTNGGGVRNCVEFRSSLYIMKAQRCYATQSNDKEALFWQCPLLDGSVGTESHGVGKIFERNSNTVDKYLIASRRGLMMFTGNFQEELTWKIKDIWNRITKIYFYKIQVMVDSDNQWIYVNLPLDGSTHTNTILFGDYSNGLDPKNIKWSLWTFPHKPIAIALDVDDVSKAVIFRYAPEHGTIVKMDSTIRTDYTLAITTTFETSELPTDSKGEVFHHGGVRFRAQGSGILRLAVTTLDGGQVINLAGVPLSAAPGIYPARIFNAQSEKVTIKGTLINNNEYIAVTKMWAFVRQLWLTRPAV